jgi:glycosidase
MKPIIYQLVVRYFGNTKFVNQINGSIHTNGCGKFNDINANALSALKDLGITHVWLTGVLRQATLTDYSAAGLPADDPDIVKGLAGSFYAVRDYFDVSPDYASTPQNRMQEFESLLQRIHDAGLQALIDLVPNHVSRGYHSTTNPASTFGRRDDSTQFFSNQNNFYYLVDPPNQALQLKKPSGWNPPGVTFDGRFGPEDGSPGHPAKATGNNVASPTPSENDWYETVKLNYGFNFVTRQSLYNPQPRTWGDIDSILAHWQAKGVDGFRCDFAHYVPKEAWTFLIGKAKQRRPAYFVAEAYPFAGSGDPIQSQEELIEAGFDAVYHYQAYNALKGIYTDGQLDAFDRELVGQTANLRGHFVSYIENHDERRVASPIVRNQGAGASGFGSADAGYQLAPLQFLYGSGPALLFNGQEIGEPGAGSEGFGGEDGRTTIYDYWAMPEFAKWVNGLRYDGAGLNSSQAALRKFYSALNQVCQNPAVAGDGFWGLRYFNNPGRFADCPGNLYCYARFQSGSGAMLLVVANFQPGSNIQGQLRVPPELSATVKLPPNVEVRMILSRSGAVNNQIGTLTVDALASTGFNVSIENQATQVYSLSASQT